MAARTHVNDAGTWRRLRNIYLNDAGTWRTIRKVYVNDSGTWRTVFTRGTEYTITAGSAGFTRGYGVSGIGSISVPLGGQLIGHGCYIEGITDDVSLNRFTLSLYGFSSNPGTTFIESIEANNITFNESSKLSYNYFAAGGFDGFGRADWTWSGVAGFSNGGQYSGVIVFS
jgi:hypothetical protein